MKAGGFTLIEVMVALAVFAVVAVALVRNTTSALQQSAAIENRTVAWWLAENEMTGLRILPRTDENYPGIGVSREQLEIGGIEWEVETAVEGTENEYVRRIVVSVYKNRSDEADAELVGFLGRY